MKKNLYILFMLFASCTNNQKKDNAPNYNFDKGKNLFINQCATCHSINKTMVGPSLGKFTDRPNELTDLFNNKSSSHKGVQISIDDLKKIENYIRNNKIFIDK